ncbi:Ff.00g099270.m01.CDS01 [Fusarium sp. VM40]|nr:Ff.00g099270.m01.CDS01 [Fusarium sp. VM40]
MVLIESLFTLCRSQRGKSERASCTILLRLYERLWSYYADLRHHVSIDAAHRFEICINYIQYHCALAVSPSPYDLPYLKASLELTKVLEMGDTTLRRPVDIYDKLNEIFLGLSGSDEAFIEFLRLVEERLSILMSSKPLLMTEKRPSPSSLRDSMQRSTATVMCAVSPA